MTIQDRAVVARNAAATRHLGAERECLVGCSDDEEAESLTLRLLREMRADMATKADMDLLRADMLTNADMHSLRADVAADLLALEARQAAEHKQTREQIVGLRRAVIEYHTTVIGYGVLISELEARVRRLEQHLDLPPVAGH